MSNAKQVRMMRDHLTFHSFFCFITIPFMICPKMRDGRSSISTRPYLMSGEVRSQNRNEPAAIHDINSIPGVLSCRGFTSDSDPFRHSITDIESASCFNAAFESVQRFSAATVCTSRIMTDTIDAVTRILSVIPRLSNQCGSHSQVFIPDAEAASVYPRP